MINNVLNTDGFYFCTDFDLTHTLQRLANTSPDFQEMSLLERVSLLPLCPVTPLDIWVFPVSGSTCQVPLCAGLAAFRVAEFLQMAVSLIHSQSR